MKLHKRHDAVTKAGLDITQAVVTTVQENELSYAELVHILTAEIAKWTKYAIRDERAEADSAG